MKKVVALVMCVLVVMSLGGCSSNYEEKSREDFHNDFIMDIRDTAPCTQMYSNKKLFKGDELYMYQLKKDEIEIFEDKVGANWTKLPLKNEYSKMLYETKEDDGMTISKRTGLPLVNTGYWCAKTSKGMVSNFDVKEDFSLAIVDIVNARIYYFKRKL